MLVLLGGVAVTRSVLGGQPAPVLNPGLVAQDATPAQLAAGRWGGSAASGGHRARAPHGPGPGHLQARSAMWSGNRLLVWSFWGDTARDAMDEPDPLPRPDAEPDGIDLWAYDPAGDRWLRLPAGPDRAATPPAGRGSLERALLRTVQRESGAVQVYVLVPAGP